MIHMVLVATVCSPLWVAPNIAVEPLYTYAGLHPQGAHFDVPLAIHNRGHDVLTVGDVSTNCVCVKAAGGGEMIAPGECYELIVRVETLDFTGRLRREVRITSNDPDQPTAKAVIEFDVIRPLTVEPPALYMGVVRPGTRCTRKVRLRVANSPKTRLLYAIASDRAVNVNLPSGPLVAGNSAIVPVTFQAPRRTGPFHATITIHTNRQDQPVLTVPIQAHVSKSVTVSTSVLDLDRFVGSKLEGESLVVQCGPKTSVARVSVSSPALRVDRIDRGDAASILVKPTRRARLGTINGVIRIETTGEENHTIQIPVTGTMISW